MQAASARRKSAPARSHRGLTGKGDALTSEASARPTLVLMCGLPGSGKTTLARRLEEEMPAVRLPPDEWMGKRALDLFNSSKRRRVERLQLVLAGRLLQLGPSVILEAGFWARRERDVLRASAGAMGVGVELRYCDVPFDELVRRLAERNRQQLPDTAPITVSQRETWWDSFQKPTPEERALV